MSQSELPAFVQRSVRPIDTCRIITHSHNTFEKRPGLDIRAFDLAIREQRSAFQAFVSWCARNDKTLTIYPEKLAP